MTVRPAISLKKIINKKYKTMDFKDELYELIGTPECSGSWIIFGESGNGKTTFALGLIKYLCQFKKTAYIPLEESTKFSFQQAIERANLMSVNSRIKIWIDFTVSELEIELSKPKAPDVIFIDSLQYLRKHPLAVNELTRFEYKQLIDMFPKKLFVFVSHAKNGEPKGALGANVYYFSDVCLQVINFVAYPKKSRYGGSTPYAFTHQFK